MAEVRFTDPASLMSQMALDLGVASGEVGMTLRKEIASELRSRVRGLRGMNTSDVSVTQVGGGKTLIRVNIRDELEPEVVATVEREFKSLMDRMGAVPIGQPVGGPAQPGLMAILSRGGIV